MPFSAPSERVVEIDPSQLRPGLFIRLPSGWMNHPFLFNQFRIHSAEQVEIIQKLGLKTVQYLPERSSTQALPRAPETARPPPPPAADPTATQVQANPTGPGDPSVTPPNPATAGTPVPPAQPADPGYQAGPYKGALTQPPADAQAKDYPVCSKTVTDSCRNRGGK